MNLAWVRPLLIRGRQWAVKNAPHILMGMGTTSSITAVIFAVQATPKAERRIADAQAAKWRETNVDDLYENIPLTVPEKIKAAAPVYIPAVGMELFSLMCFWGAHGINMSRQAVLAGCLSTAEQALIEYQRKTMELIGDKAEKEIRIANAQEHIDRNPPPAMIVDTDADCWCYYKGYRFRSSYRKLKDIQNDANHEMITNMYLSESDLLWMFDPERHYIIPDGDSRHVGWSVDKMMVFDLLPVMGADHQPAIEIDIRDKDGREYHPKPGFSASL